MSSEPLFTCPSPQLMPAGFLCSVHMVGRDKLAGPPFPSSLPIPSPDPPSFPWRRDKFPLTTTLQDSSVAASRPPSVHSPVTLPRILSSRSRVLVPELGENIGPRRPSLLVPA